MTEEKTHAHSAATTARTLDRVLRVAALERSLAFYRALGYEVVGTVPDAEFGPLTGLVRLFVPIDVGLARLRRPQRRPCESRMRRRRTESNSMPEGEVMDV
jgi:catechol 2,3-dioxygenase-like lactoylglutathione lyase family enzyme